MNKAKNIISFCASIAVLFFTGCSGLTNLTPERVPENSSRVYTLTMSAYINDGAVIKDTIKPYIVIDEQVIPMKEVKDMKEGYVEKTFPDTSMTDEPVMTTVRYEAPFFQMDREADYHRAWEIFEQRFGKVNSAS